METCKRLADAAPKGPTLDIDDTCKEAWEDVRNDGSATKWCTFVYADKQKITLGSKGEGGYDDFVGQLEDDKVLFVVFRCQAGGQTKFGFVTWVGANVAGMARARSSQHAISVKNFTEGIHMDMFVSDKDEISPALISEKFGVKEVTFE